MPRLIKNNCKFCKNKYIGYGKIYCSKSCRAKDTGVGHGIKTGRWVECSICKKQIWRKGYLIKKYTLFFCSKNCLGIVNAKRIQEKYENKTRHWLVGENNHEWKGNNVKYNALHDWVRRKLGTPRKCEHCGTISANKYEWANMSKKYKRDINDWKRLCSKCHTIYDDRSGKMKKIRSEKFWNSQNI